MTKTADGPIVIADSADSRGAGATGDSAEPLGVMLPFASRLRCAVSVFDSSAVEKAFRLGVGGVADFELGATVAPRLSSPVTVKNATVKGLFDGDFYMHGPSRQGMLVHQGRTAVLSVGKILILLYAGGNSEYDLNFYRSFGIDVEKCDLVSVKACTSFRAGYEKIASEIINVSTAGAACPTLERLPYKKRPRLYPFDEIGEEDITRSNL